MSAFFSPSTFDFPSRAEAIDTLVFIFEEHGVFVTPADVEPLAARIVTEHADGAAEITCTVPELLTLAREFIPLMGERAECPHAWCTGARTAHASLDPSEWAHASEQDELAPGSMLLGQIHQTGAGAPSYVLDVNAAPRPPALTAADVLALADEFERHAVTLRERAAQLDACGGIQ